MPVGWKLQLESNERGRIDGLMHVEKGNETSQSECLSFIGPIDFE